MSDYKKPFSQELFNQNDPRGREAAKKIFEKLESMKGSYVIDNFANKYAADLYVMTEVGEDLFKLSTIEVEVKKAFQGITWSFPDIHIPARKLKFTGASWIMLNADCTAGFFIPAEAFIGALIVKKKNIYSGGKLEDFISIPTEKAELVILKEPKPKDDRPLY